MAYGVSVPTVYRLAEIVEKLELPDGIETARRAIQAMGYRRKKKMIHASEQERPPMYRLRENTYSVDWFHVGTEILIQ